MSKSELPNITKSNQIYDKAVEIMPPVTQTLAKGPGQYVNGVAPKYLESAKGSRVIDVDGNEFIDLNMAIGPISLGYCYQKIDDAIKEQLDKGITFSLMHRLEYEASALISEVVPNAEMVRISKSGADVCSAAIRVARAYTGREKVLCCGYHGWHDWYITTTVRDGGIPSGTKELIETFSYNDIDDFISKLDEDIAAVILEPFIFEKPKNDFLEKIISLSEKNGTLVIFDEMWTGFRVALGGAQEFFNLKADLATFSKAVANGMPISFLTGKKEVMKLFDEDLFFFNTFGGEALSLAATIATIKEMRETNYFDHISKLGKTLQDGFNAISNKNGFEDDIQCIGYPCRTMISISNTYGDPLLIKSFIQQEMIRNGILWGGFHNLSYSHSENDISDILDAYAHAMSSLRLVVDQGKLDSSVLGKQIEPVFRQTKY